MNPIDFRNETWASLQQRLTGLRLEVYHKWLIYSPGSTRDVALRAGMDILTFRPRTTELFQMGLLELAPKQPSGLGEGIYQAVALDTAEKRFQSKKSEAIARQMPLKI